MSIVALKRKTAVQYNNMSVGTNGFSLNGTRRLQGFVGQTSLSRYNHPNVMRGNAIKGHGGCCGKYPIYPLIQSVTCLTEDSNVIKSSVLSNKGMIDTKYRWIRRPAPYATVKPDSNLNVNTQSQYVVRVHRRTIDAFSDPACAITTKKPIVKCNPANENNIILSTCTNTFEPEPAKHKYMDSSEYIDYITNLVITNNDIPYIPNTNSNTPFTC
jgi:hypothetical protein